MDVAEWKIHDNSGGIIAIEFLCRFLKAHRTTHCIFIHLKIDVLFFVPVDKSFAAIVDFPTTRPCVSNMQVVTLRKNRTCLAHPNFFFDMGLEK